ncbi:uncharacterized protein LOC123987836 [Osmia bicornis bicornis]|uniref:uncharacterized protein LOC123987836 n=1 Tax=Osmia bicornis bicornis TaxID=1437191 RepID=UPI001EAF773E|nr:uncharacterized protein LOC123987836 [Osmia bicornis bicornis]
MDEQHESSQLSIQALLRKVDMEWTNEMALRLIDEYEKYPILWNLKDEFHYSRNKKIDAWEAIAKVFGMQSSQAKQKMNSLLASFRREKAKGARSIGKGKARKDVYISKWFAFKRMLYLLDKDEPRATLDTKKESCNKEINAEQPIPHKNPIENTDTNEIATPVPPKRRKRAYEKRDEERLEEAFKILKQSVSKEQPDECETYTKHIANKLRSYSIRTRAQVEYAINKILFEADMGICTQIRSGAQHRVH